MAHDGSIIIDVDVLTKQAEKHLDSLKKKAEDNADVLEGAFDLEVEKLSVQFEKAAASMKKVNDELNETKGKLEALDILSKDLSLAEIEVKDAYQDKHLLDMQEKNKEISLKEYVKELPAINRNIAEAEAKVQSLKDAIENMDDGGKLEKQLMNQNHQLENQTRNMDLLTIRKQELENRMDSTVDKAKQLTAETQETSKSMREASISAESMGKSIKGGFKSILKYAGALFGIRTIYQSLRTLANEWMNSDDLAAQQMKANMEGIKNILVNAIAPVVQFVGDLIMNIVGYISAFLKLFFGVNLAAKKAGKTVKKGVGGSMSQAKDDAKELQTILAGFDKAEVVSIQKETGSGGGGAGGGGGFDVAPVFDISPFEKQIAKLKKLLDDLWNSDKMQRFFKSFQTVATNTFNLIKSVGGNLWGNIVITWNEMLPNLLDGFDNLTELFVRVWEDIALTTDEWFPVIGDTINRFVDSIFDTFRPLLVFISELWSDFTDIMLTIWNEYGAPILDEIMRFIDGMIETFNLIWTEIIDPIISPAIQMMKELWEEHVKDILLELGRLIGDFILGALEFYNEFIHPIVQWLVKLLGPIFSKVFNGIFSVVSSVMGNMLGSIKGVIGNIRGVFQGLLTFLEGVFTGNWSKIWSGLVQIFSNIIGGIVNIFKFPINTMIDGLNFFIRQINRIKIPSWVPGVGGKGINIGQIPHLAKGGVLRQPTLNVAGEYAGAKRNPEIVTPQDIMLDTVRKALAEQDNNGNGDITIHVVNELDGRVVSETTEKVKAKDMMQNNGGLRTAWT